MFTTKIVLFCSLLLEEYVPIIKYIKGTDNDESDALVRFIKIISDIKERYITR